MLGPCLLTEGYAYLRKKRFNLPDKTVFPLVNSMIWFAISTGYRSAIEDVSYILANIKKGDVRSICEPCFQTFLMDSEVALHFPEQNNILDWMFWVGCGPSDVVECALQTARRWFPADSPFFPSVTKSLQTLISKTGSISKWITPKANKLCFWERNILVSLATAEVHARTQNRNESLGPMLMIGAWSHSESENQKLAMEAFRNNPTDFDGHSPWESKVTNATTHLLMFINHDNHFAMLDIAIDIKVLTIYDGADIMRWKKIWSKRSDSLNYKLTGSQGTSHKRFLKEWESTVLSAVAHATGKRPVVIQNMAGPAHAMWNPEGKSVAEWALSRDSWILTSPCNLPKKLQVVDCKLLVEQSDLYDCGPIAYKHFLLLLDGLLKLTSPSQVPERIDMVKDFIFVKAPTWVEKCLDSSTLSKEQNERIHQFLQGSNKLKANFDMNTLKPSNILPTLGIRGFPGTRVENIDVPIALQGTQGEDEGTESLEGSDQVDHNNTSTEQRIMETPKSKTGIAWTASKIGRFLKKDPDIWIGWTHCIYRDLDFEEGPFPPTKKQARKVKAKKSIITKTKGTEWAIRHTSGVTSVFTLVKMIGMTTMANLMWCIEHKNQWRELDDDHRIQKTLKPQPVTWKPFNENWSRSQLKAVATELRLLRIYMDVADSNQIYTQFPKEATGDWYNKVGQGLIFFSNPIIGFVGEMERKKLVERKLLTGSPGVYSANIFYKTMRDLSNSNSPRKHLSTEMIDFYLAW